MLNQLSQTAAWTILVIAGLLEVCWSVGMKYTDGFSKLWPSVMTISAMVISMYLLAKAVNFLPLGTAYGVWVGIGTVGASILGILLFKESANPLRLMFLVLLIISIVGLKLTNHSD
jgi:quaternary ammonium compound-resistance protein SugE